MKLPILIGVLLASISLESRQMVTVITPLDSGPEVRIVTLQNGKGRAGVRVDIFRSDRLFEEEKHVSTLVSEDGGRIKLPPLVPGYYHLEAVVADKTRARGDEVNADLYLYVSSHSRPTPTLFPLELVDPVAQRENLREDLIVKAEQKPVSSIIREFRGTVYDMTGAVIPGAEIRVMRKGTQGKVTVVLLKSDEKGEFQKNLPDGEYVAQISRLGFETRVFLFKISEKGDQQLTVRLDVASVSEEVSISQAILPQTK